MDHADVALCGKTRVPNVVVPIPDPCFSASPVWKRSKKRKHGKMHRSRALAIRKAEASISGYFEKGTG